MERRGGRCTHVADPRPPREDEGVDRAARLLYVLYVEDLRRLQDQVNGCIAKAQEFTANPRTNAALGKLGR